MSTATDTSSASESRKYLNFDEFIDFQLHKTRSRIKTTDLLTAAVAVGAILIGYLLVFVVLDQWVIPGGVQYLARVIMLSVVVGAISSVLIWRLVIPAFKEVNPLFAAREIEHADPNLKGNLLTLVDLKQAGRTAPRHIHSAMEKRAALELSHVNIDDAVDKRLLLKLSYVLLAVVVLFCAYALFSPKRMSSSIMRALLPAVDVSVATKTRIEKIDPGHAEVLVRANLPVQVDLSGEIPEEVTLLYTTNDRRFVDEPVLLRDTGEGINRFRGVVTGENARGILQGFTYRIVAGDASSDIYEVRVIQPPTAAADRVDYDYPDYMRLDDKTDPGGSIDAWEGTRVTVHATTNMPVRSAMILFSDTEDTSVKAEEIPMNIVDGTHLSATWVLQFRQDGSYPKYYRIQVRNARGDTDPAPTLQTVRIRPDMPPRLTMLYPTGDLELPANAVLPIAFEAMDPDFLLTVLDLRLEREGEEFQRVRIYEGPPYESEVRGTYELPLSSLRVQPGDRLAMWLEARDNLVPFGTRTENRTVTAKVHINIIAPVEQEQVEQQLDQQREQAEQRLDQAEQQRREQQDPRQPPEPQDHQQPEERPQDPMVGDQQQPQQGESSEAGQPGEQQDGQSQSGEAGTQQTAPAGEGRDPAETEQMGDDQQADPQRTEQSEGTGRPQEGEAGMSESDAGAGREPTPAGDSSQMTPSQAGEPQSREGQPADDRSGQPQESTPGEAGDQTTEGGQGVSESGERPQGTAESDPSAQRERTGEQDQASSQRGEDPSARRPDGSPPPEDELLRNLLEWDRERRQQEQTSGSRDEQNPAAGRDAPMSDPQAPREGTAPMPEDGSAAEGASQPVPDMNDMGPDEGGSQRTPDTQPPTDDDPMMGDPARGTGAGEGMEERPGETGQPEPMETADPSDSAGQVQPQPGDSAREAESGQAMTPGEPEDSPMGRHPEGINPMPSDPSAMPEEEPGAETTPATRPGEEDDRTAERPSGRPESEDPSAARPMDPAPTEGQPGNVGSGAPQDSDPSKPSTDGPGEGMSDPSGAPAESGSPGGMGDPSQGGQSSQQGMGEPGTPGPDGQSTQIGQPGSGEPSATQPGENGTPDSNGMGQGEDGMPDETGAAGQNPDGIQGSSPQGQQSEPGTGEADEGMSPESGMGETGGDEPSMGQGDPMSGQQPMGAGREEEGDSGQPAQSGQAGDRAGSESGQPGEEGQPGDDTGPGTHDRTTRDNQPARGLHDNAIRDDSGTSSPVRDDAALAESSAVDEIRESIPLALQRLKDQLERGEVDQETLERLGATPDQLRRFADELERRLADTGNDDSPEAQARRRQFDALLRGIDLESTGDVREAGELSDVEAFGFGTQRRITPPEYRADEEGYRRELLRPQQRRQPQAP